MNRREFVGVAASAPLLGATVAGKNQYFELRWFYFRNGSQPPRANEFYEKVWAPTAQRLGIGPVGFFSPVIGEGSPYMLRIASFPSMGDVEFLHSRMMQDSGFAKLYSEWHRPLDPGYVRTENAMLKAFDGMPALTIPPDDGKRAPKIFELRTYESNDPNTLRRKVKMFNDGEMGIFQRVGMAPVFFGETIVGRNQPSLTYMLSYDDLAARDRLWAAFVSDPEWKKLRSTPGLSDAEIVSNISNAILRPTSFSGIR